MPESNRLRRTKIIATIGPASNTPMMLESLLRAGVDVVRLNFSHGDHASHRRVFETIRSAEQQVGRPIAILQDLQGPKIRLGKLNGTIQLNQSAEIILSSRNDFVGENLRLPTTYASLSEDVRVHERILLADGRVELEVLAIEGTDVRCRVLTGGALSSSKGINLPGTLVSTPSVSEKDLEDLKFGLQLGVDYVAQSFVREAHDVTALRGHMQNFGRTVPIIAKIEKPQAIENLSAIIRAADGIMIARGDLGVELPAEQVPTIQERAIKLARTGGKIAVVATQMLMSMTTHQRPTQAEISDVANAVFEGADAVMLSDETAAGSFPVLAVEMMAAVARVAEESPTAYSAPQLSEELRASSAYAIARAAVVMAEERRADAIVSATQRGFGPRLLAQLRPRCPIIGLATTDEEVRHMAFFWGVQPLRIDAPDSVENLVKTVEQVLVGKGIIHKGATLVMTSKMPFVEGQATNMLKLHVLPGA